MTDVFVNIMKKLAPSLRFC